MLESWKLNFPNFKSESLVLRVTCVSNDENLTIFNDDDDNDIVERRCQKSSNETRKRKKRQQKTTFYLFFFCVRVCARCSFVSFEFRWKNENSVERSCVYTRLIPRGAVLLPASKSKANEWILRPRPMRLAATPVKRNRNAWLLRNTHPSISYRRCRCNFFQLFLLSFKMPYETGITFLECWIRNWTTMKKKKKTNTANVSMLLLPSQRI